MAGRRGKDSEKKENIYSQITTLAATVVDVVVDCIVFFPSHNDYLRSSRTEKSWKSMACIDAMIKIIETSNVSYSLHVDILFCGYATLNTVDREYFIWRTIFAWYDVKQQMTDCHKNEVM